jgi:hypothetical protein
MLNNAPGTYDNPMSSEAVVLAVVSFLALVLFFSSSFSVNTFARPKNPTSDITCNKKLDLKTGKWDGSSYQCCYWSLDSRGHAQNYYCADCFTSADGASLACNDYVLVAARPGVSTTSLLPNPVGNALPPPTNSTGTPRGGGIIKAPPVNPTSALPPSNNASTVLPGSIFKVPPGTTNALPPSGSTTGGPVAVMSSDNPPGCSKKVPIPPNCTLNPFNNSALNKGTVSLGNIIKAPVNHTNALSIGNNASTPPPALKLSQPSLAGQQPQTQQTTGHHHKGSNTGASTSTGSNSTGR